MKIVEQCMKIINTQGGDLGVGCKKCMRYHKKTGGELCSNEYDGQKRPLHDQVQQGNAKTNSLTNSARDVFILCFYERRIRFGKMYEHPTIMKA